MEVGEHPFQVGVHDTFYILHWHGRTLHEVGKYAAALVSFGRAISRHPDEIVHRLSRAAALSHLGRDEEWLEAALSINPEDATGLRYRAYALDFLERYEEAARAYERAIDVRPDDAILRKSHERVLSRLETGSASPSQDDDG
ncbi:tetratricopeptide repeat protein [Nonomuraea fuscirosea]|uniref:tetratricopeptide repeat protein n=1 Tax=Nonomuraea fuscirosea TaxID=1291556 RepID=UPI0033E5DAC0